LGLAWNGRNWNRFTVILAAYAALAAALVPERRQAFKSSGVASLLADGAYFGFCTRIAATSWLPVAALSFLLTSAVILGDVTRTAAVAVLAVAMSALLSYPRWVPLTWFASSFGAFAIAVSAYKSYLNGRLTNATRQSVLSRSDATSARDSERARIANDFHDGPLQDFVSFQMRLEVIKTLLARGRSEEAKQEVCQLQENCKGQVADLRSFARSMRPSDDDFGFQESLSQILSAFERDTGIVASLALDGAIAEPSGSEDLLQIVREALHNIHKHSGASRVTISASKLEGGVNITVEDDGSGFPFTGKFNLDELDRQHIGPISIKRRVHSLNGELVLESHPNRGAKLEIRIPA
jgi:signal transduction histidine kinase